MANSGKSLNNLIKNNQRWAQTKLTEDPDFFSALVHQQTPEYLWIGCADSRVPANEIVGLQPGELFVHRNIANVVVHTDLNCLSVIQFAVDVLKVKHILVVGHSGCSGVKASLNNMRVGLADIWLGHVKDVEQMHEKYLGEVLSSDERLNRMIELNVIEQVVNVCETLIVQDAWKRGQSLTIHGWAYSLHTGLVNDLGFSVNSLAELDENRIAALKKYE